MASANRVSETVPAKKRSFFNRTFYPAIKRVFDIVVSIIAVILLSPLLIAVSVIIKAQDGGEVIHKRWCVGKKRRYPMYKFRSMVPDANNYEKYFTKEQYEAYKKEIKLENDPRITKIGRFIRKTSIDELPQLFNVIKGEMSLVGPRPVVDSEVIYYGDDLERLLSAKPGLTGNWQVNGRSDCTYESGKRQILELYYVENRSIPLDIKILFKTVGAVLREEGAR